MSYDPAVLDHYLAPLRAHLDRPGVRELVVNRPGEFMVTRKLVEARVAIEPGILSDEGRALRALL